MTWSDYLDEVNEVLTRASDDLDDLEYENLLDELRDEAEIRIHELTPDDDDSDDDAGAAAEE